MSLPSVKTFQAHLLECSRVEMHFFLARKLLPAFFFFLFFFFWHLTPVKQLLCLLVLKNIFVWFMECSFFFFFLLGAVALVSLARAVLVARFCCVKLLLAVWWVSLSLCPFQVCQIWAVWIRFFLHFAVCHIVESWLFVRLILKLAQNWAVCFPSYFFQYWWWLGFEC